MLDYCGGGEMAPRRRRVECCGVAVFRAGVLDQRGPQYLEVNQRVESTACGRRVTVAKKSRRVLATNTTNSLPPRSKSQIMTLKRSGGFGYVESLSAVTAAGNATMPEPSALTA